MKFEKAILILPFSQAQFLNGKLGGEVILQEGETIADGLTELKRQCDEWYNKTFPTAGTFNQIAPSNMNVLPEREQVIALKEVNLAHEKIEIAIDNCTSLDELFSMTVPDELKVHYIVKQAELSKIVHDKKFKK